MKRKFVSKPVTVVTVKFHFAAKNTFRLAALMAEMAETAAAFI